jgi:hypothetical protein
MLALLLSTTMHILTRCTYTEALWQAPAASYDLQDYHQMALGGGPVEWVRYMSSGGNKDVQRRNLGILFRFWWMTWKVRNRRIFL